MNRNYKLLELEMNHTKNVKHGIIHFNYKKEPLNVVGIYSQNGSGKTTVIETMDMIRTLISGNNLQPFHFDLFTDSPIKFRVTFQINHILAIYKFSAIYQPVNKRILITHEALKMKTSEENSRI